jgi:hypothetical protein
MAEQRIIVEYSVESKHLTNTIEHGLLFSPYKRRFIKPSLRDKSRSKLVYKLLPGNYIEFKLFTNRSSDYAHFSILSVRVNDENYEVKSIYDIELSFTVFRNAEHDQNAPQVLRDFIKMMPAYHSVAYVEINEYNEDINTIIESIKKYLTEKTISE